MEINIANSGGWEQSEMRAWLKEEISPLIPSAVQDAIKPVIKYTCSFCYENMNTLFTVKSTEDLWIPSAREVFGLPAKYEETGSIYGELFSNDFDRVKTKSGTSEISRWWVDSVKDDNLFI